MPSKLLTRKGGRVYVASNGKKVKVGMSSRGKCVARFRELERDFEFEAKETWMAERRYDFRIIEKMAHKKLSEWRLGCEFFDVKMEHAIDAVKQCMAELDASGFSGDV